MSRGNGSAPPYRGGPHEEIALLRAELAEARQRLRLCEDDLRREQGRRQDLERDIDALRARDAKETHAGRIVTLASVALGLLLAAVAVAQRCGG
jgi:hypothetical protein